MNKWLEEIASKNTIKTFSNSKLRFLLMVLSGTAIFTGLNAIIKLYIGFYIEFYLNSFVFLINAVIAILLIRGHNYVILSIIFTSIIILLTIILIITCGLSTIILLWIPSIVISSYYMNGYRIGNYFSVSLAIFFFVLGVATFFGFQVLDILPLNDSKLIRIFTMFSVIVMTIYLNGDYEKSRNISENQLEDKNEELGRLVEEYEALMEEKSDVFTNQYALRKLEGKRNEILKSIILGRGLDEILLDIVKIAEEQTELIVSITLAGIDGKSMIPSASTKLPDVYNEAFSKLKVGANICSCGVAMYSKKPVVTEDIYVDMNWTPLLEVVKKTELKSCYSVPILSADSKVYGSLAVYNTRKYQPSVPIKQFLDSLVNIISLAIEVSNIAKAKAEKDKLELERKEIQRSLEFKTDFLAQMSHEIRTPLNGVIGMADILAKNTTMTIDQKEYLNTMQSSGYDLMRIINDILDMSKIEAGKMQLTTIPYKLATILKKTRDLYLNKAEEKHLDLELNISDDLPVSIKVDPVRLSQILNNIISNAIKFTEKGSVTINAELVEKKEGAVKILFSISDTGPGISEKDQVLLFSKYDQVGASVVRGFDGKSSGTGLGLFICTNLIEMMGGNLKVRSALRKGSQFYFEAEFDIVELKEEKAVEKINDKFDICVLIVEDKVVNQKVAELMLVSLGCRVDIVNNGEECLFKYKDNQDKYDLILMDIQMPIMDGVTATAELKANFQNVPPVIALSANAMEGDAEKYLSAGLDGFMSKPVIISALRDKLNEYFS